MLDVFLNSRICTCSRNRESDVERHLKPHRVLARRAPSAVFPDPLQGFTSSSTGACDEYYALAQWSNDLASAYGSNGRNRR